jgi:Rhs element Vgr protein
MAISPQKDSEGLISYEISIDGNPLPDSLQIYSIFIEKHINKIPIAEIEILDGSIHEQNQGWKAIKDGKLKIGNDVEVKAGYGTKTKNSIYKGYITSVRVVADRNEISSIVIECADKAIQMCLNLAYTPFEKQKDSAIIQNLIRNHTGLTADIESTPITHPYIAQYGVTDWDFMLARAEANGLIINVEGGKISGKKPGSGAKELVVTWGLDIINLDIALDGRHQKVRNTSYGWDMANQAKTEGGSSEPSLPDIGNGEVSASNMASKLEFKNDEIRSSTPLKTNELREWANAILIKSRINRIKGKVRFQGSHKIKPNDKLEIKEAGDQFNGDAFVSGVVQVIKDGNWYTEAILGYQKEFHIGTQNNVSVSNGNNLVPGVNGLVIGKVTKIHQDPDNQYRVEVNIPSIDDENKVWARISNLWATNNAGTFFYPEIGDEVILGFLDGDPRFPIILGKLYSSKLKPPYSPEDRNPIQAFVSKDQLKLEFDNKNKVTTLSTPGGINLILSDKDKRITLEDSYKNKFTMDSNGIIFDTKFDFKSTAKGAIEMKATRTANLEAVGNLTMKGMAFTLEGTSTGLVKSNAPLTISSSAITTIKGTMVKIN